MISILKRSGRTEILDITKIQKMTSESTFGIPGVSQSVLELDAQIKFIDGMSSSAIQDSLIKTAVEKIDIDVPGWTFVAARLFIFDLYHRVGMTTHGDKGTAYCHLSDYLKYGKDAGRLLPALGNHFDLEKLNAAIKPERDMLFNYLGIKTLYDRYLIKDKNKEPIELPQHMFMAIAMFLAQKEDPILMNDIAIQFYDVISKFEVMLATPTLSNARTNRHQLSSCYIGSSPDNIEGIFDGYKEMALLSKFGGGIGWDWNQIRALGGVIDDHKSAAGGTVPFLKITNDIAIAVDQLGTRKGAIAVYLEPWHMDIIDFIDLKKNSGEERRRAHDLFPALWISDIFMERVLEDGHWTLFDPYEVKDLSECHGDEFKAKYIAYENDPSITKITMKAKDLWKKVLTSYFESGSPCLCFKDTAISANPNSHVGLIRSSNLCTEIFQNTNPDKYWVKLWVTTVEDKDETTKETEAIDHPLLEKQNVGGDIIDSEVYYLVQEDDILMLEDGSYKKGNKVTSLDVLRGIVDKVKTLEEPANIEKIKNGETSLNFVVEMFENRLAVFNVEKEKIDGNTAVCNLASVNLSRINTIEDIERVVPIAVRMLDNVIDLNFYPLKKVKVTNMRSRSIGLGVMGEAEMLAVSKIHFGSQEHRNKIDQIMEAISYNTIRSSMELALEKSPYPDFNGSKWSKGIFPMDHATDETNDLTSRELHYDWETLKDEVRWNGVRNGDMMAIAPTSSISILVGTTQAIEPAYKRKWFEENLSGLIPVVVPHLSPETWNYYTPAFEIDQLNIIKAAAIRQKWIDQGQSTNIFMNLDKASGKHLHEIYVLAWKLGLKSTYYLRSQSPEAKNDVEDRSMECSGCQ